MRYLLRGTRFGLALAVCAILCTAGGLSASTITLPSVFDSNDLLQSTIAQPERQSVQVQLGARAYGDNNIGSIWDLDGKLPAHDFGGGSAYASLQTSEWLAITHKGWWVGAGTFERDGYEGNSDAAQLWIDMNSDGQTQSSYAPVAANTNVSADWFGVGHDFRLKVGRAAGEGMVSLRRLSASSFLARSITGEVEGDMFTGMMRVLKSDTSHGDVTGTGWAMDMQARVRGNKWIGQVTVEGLLGEMSWHDLQIEDSLIVSPRTFTDPDGFLHDCGGVTGAIWYDKRSYSINPYYRLDLISLNRPNLLLGYAWQSGMKTAPYLGVAWSWHGRWTPYTRYYPVQRRLELGAVGRGWQVRIAGDDWIFGAPSTAEIGVSAQAVRF